MLPELAFAVGPGIGWSALIAMPSWLRQVGLQAVFLLAIPGIAAVLEFAERGNGTPIPYDPPSRLVTSGVYRYVANPMQLSCTAVLLACALLLRNGWLLLAPLMAVVYSVGLATWDETADLHTRFRDPWTFYRAAVPNWRPRWRPFHAGPNAVLYIARGCGPCSQLRRWIEARHPLGLTVLDAESLPAGTIQRMRYDPRDGTPAVHGVRAMARVLEHLHLGWAYCGAALGLPGTRHFIQICLDAGGLGPRTLPAEPSPINSHLTCLPLISKQTSTPNAWRS